MNLDHLLTFLEVASCGNFNRAAERLNVTQSTVSARIKALETRFGHALFQRAHAGATLTAAGRQLEAYARNIHHQWQQAHQAVTLPAGFTTLLNVSAQVSLWDRLVLRWIPWMRRRAPHVALRVDTDYSNSQMRQLIDGLLDIGVMYQPRPAPGLIVEKLLEERLVLVSTDRRDLSPGWVADYVYVDWGDVFRAQHGSAFPEMETPAVSVGLGALGLRYILENRGSGYFPLRVVEPLIAQGRLHRLAGAPVMGRPAYVVYHSQQVEAETLALALEGLRQAAQAENVSPTDGDSDQGPGTA